MRRLCGRPACRHAARCRCPRHRPGNHHGRRDRRHPRRHRAAADRARPHHQDRASSTNYRGANPDSRAYAEAQKLYFFYGSRHFEPLWLSEGADGKPAFSAERRSRSWTSSSASAAEGFRPSDYLTPDLDLAAAGTDPLKLAAVETAFSAVGAALCPARLRRPHRPDRRVSSLWTVTPKTINDTEMLMKLASADDPAAVLAELEPKHTRIPRCSSRRSPTSTTALVERADRDPRRRRC